MSSRANKFAYMRKAQREKWNETAETVNEKGRIRKYM